MDLILYSPGTSAYDNMGMGVILCTRAEVTEELNGIYELEFETPIIGRHYADIEEGCIVTAPHDDTKERQPFKIYKRSAPIDGIVTFWAQHISYELNKVVIRPYTAESCAAALIGMETYAINPKGFTFWTDVTATGNFAVTAPVECRKILGGTEGSILDTYGGEYEFDDRTVKLHARRGRDTDVNIIYGKNLVSMKNDIDAGNTYNAVVPFWTGQNGELVTVDGYLVKRANMPADEPIFAISLDLTSEYQEQPTPAQLQAAAEQRLASGRPWLQNQNVKVDFVALWQTAEYADVAPLQRLNLSDTAVISHPALGITNERQKVIKTVYNVLTERYNKMELGQRQTTLGQTIAEAAAERVMPPTRSFLTAAIEHATQMITGGLGGNILYKLNANGEPEEILIMDTDDIATAVNVIRLNMSGIGFSRTGYNGPYTTAWTIDGHFVADFITSGTLNANLIRAGIISDEGGNSYWDLESGLMNFVGNMTMSRPYTYGSRTSGTLRSNVGEVKYYYLDSNNNITSNTGMGLAVANEQTAGDVSRYGVIPIVFFDANGNIVGSRLLTTKYARDDIEDIRIVNSEDTETNASWTREYLNKTYYRKQIRPYAFSDMLDIVFRNDYMEIHKTNYFMYFGPGGLYPGIYVYATTSGDPAYIRLPQGAQINLGNNAKFNMDANATIKATTSNLQINGVNVVKKARQNYLQDTFANGEVITTPVSAEINNVESFTGRATKLDGGVVSLYIEFTLKPDITVGATGDIADKRLFTLQGALYPARKVCAISDGDDGGQAWFAISAAGVISLTAVEGTGAQRTLQGGLTNFRFGATYIAANANI